MRLNHASALIVVCASIALLGGCCISGSVNITQPAEGSTVGSLVNVKADIVNDPPHGYDFSLDGQNVTSQFTRSGNTESATLNASPGISHKLTVTRHGYWWPLSSIFGESPCSASHDTHFTVSPPPQPISCGAHQVACGPLGSQTCIQEDANNCGSCGHACGAGESCNLGKCYQQDPSCGGSDYVSCGLSGAGATVCCNVNNHENCFKKASGVAVCCGNDRTYDSLTDRCQ